MSRAGIVALGLLTFFPARAEGAGEAPVVRIELRLHGGSRQPAPAVVTVTAAGEAQPGEAVQAEVPGSLDLPVAGRPPWTVRVAAPGWWSAPLVLGSPVEAPIRVDLWPETRVLGRLRVPADSRRPATVALRLRSSDLEVEPLPEATVLCPVDEDGRLDCGVPRIADMDLRLRAPGFASRFFWSLDLSAADSHDLGVVALRPGASVVGQVQVPPGHHLDAVVARLTPLTGSDRAGDAERERVRRQAMLEARPDERGFFAFEELAAGAYRLEVTHPTLASHELAPLRVIEGGQSEVAETIVLTEPAPLRLLLDPLFDPHGEDWRVEMLRLLGAGQAPTASAESMIVATAGLVTVPLAPAVYEVRVLDSRGVRVATGEVVHTPGGELHVLEIRPIFLDGLVTLGTDPLIARIVFRGPSTLEMHADLDGRFGGYLPRAGEWDVEIEATDPPVRRRTRAVEIELEDQGARASLHLRVPDTALRATVVDEHGSLAAGAHVTVTDPLHSTREVSAVTDEDGAVLLRGLDEGIIQAQAELRPPHGEEASSRPVSVELRESRSAEVRLVLRPHLRLRGRLVAADGNPIPNATLEALPFTDAGVLDALFAQPRSTDAAGRFDISLPGGTEAVHLTALAPGHPLTQRVVPVDDVGDLTLGNASGSLTVHLPMTVAEVPWNNPTTLRPGLVHASGAKLPLALLSRWAGVHGIAWQVDDRAVAIPQLAVGRYGVCWFDAAEWMVRTARGTGCVHGELAAEGAVSLHLPSPTARSVDPGAAEDAPR